MDSSAIRNAIFQKYIVPTKRRKSPLIGVEIEMPVATLDGGPTRHSVCQEAFYAAAEHFGFEMRQFDAKGVCYNAVRPDNGDDLSFDCSFNNLELSLGCESDMREIQRRFETYVRFINGELIKKNHLLTGMGVNPNYRINNSSYVETGRYGMLGAYLRKCHEWEGDFHPYPEYGTFASASQVQLDVEEDEIALVLKAFSLIEPLKAVLFANAVMDEEPELACVRDMFWEKSTHGINPRNVGFYDAIPQSPDELVDYLSGTSMFCTEREGHYLFFKPIPASEYFSLSSVEAQYYEDGLLSDCTFAPQPSDLAYLRTYKHVDLTYRGTVEFRSCCCQPLSQAMTVPAFHVGLMARLPQLFELVQASTLLNGGPSSAQLRALMNRRDWQSFVDAGEVSELCLRMLDLCREGLQSRGFGEEAYLEPLYKRAETLTSPALAYLNARAEGVSQSELVQRYSLL